MVVNNKMHDQVIFEQKPIKNEIRKLPDINGGYIFHSTTRLHFPLSIIRFNECYSALCKNLSERYHQVIVIHD